VAVLISRGRGVWHLESMSLKRFSDRTHAGRALAADLKKRSWSAPLVVVALPRGGVPVAAEIARELHAPLDILMVRKIGTPAHEELACGAIAAPDVVIWNRDILSTLGLSRESLAPVVEREREEMSRRERAIRSFLTPSIPLDGAAVVLVDDGVATGATMKAAVKAVRAWAPKEIVLALPVAPSDTYAELRNEKGTEVVCLTVAPVGEFGSVGSWYEDFSQVETEACRDLLEANRHELKRESERHGNARAADECHRA